MAAAPSSESPRLPAPTETERAPGLLGLVQAHPRARAIIGLVCLALAGLAAYRILGPQLMGLWYWRKALQANEVPDFRLAQSYLDRCLQIWPESGEAHYLAARVCRRAGDLENARAHLLEAERRGWPQAQVDMERLLIQAQTGIVQPIQVALLRYAALRPSDDHLIFEGLVMGCVQSNFLDQAFHWTNVWLERHPNDWQARFWHGRILEGGNRYELAIEEYSRILEQRPKHAQAHLRLAEVLLLRGRDLEAQPHFETYLESHPDSPEALLGLARCQRTLSPPEVALATLDRLLKAVPDHPGALLLRGQMELSADRPKEAVTWLKRAVALAPQDMETNQSLATAYHLLKEDSLALQYDRKKAQIESDLRRMEDLIKEILVTPKDVNLRYEAGKTLIRLGQDQQAVRWLVSALLLDKTHQPTRTALSECLQRLGDTKLMEAYRQIVRDAEPTATP